MVQLLEMGAVSKLPEDVQWSVRVLLPRKEDPAVAAARAAAQAASGAAPNLNGSLLAPAALPALGGAAALPQYAPQQQQPVASLPLLGGQVVLQPMCLEGLITRSFPCSCTHVRTKTF